MKFLIEHEPDRWTVEFSTSSSKEVYRYIVPAGGGTVLSTAETKVIRALPKVEAAQVAHYLGKEADTRTNLSSETRITPPSSSSLPPRDPRRRTLWKRISRIITHFTCTPSIDRTVVGEQVTRHIDPMSVNKEVKYREMPELFGSDVPCTPETLLPEYRKFSGQTLFEMYSPPSDASPPTRSTSTSNVVMLHRRGARRGGAPTGRRVFNAPVARDHDLQLGTVSNVDSGPDIRVGIRAVQIDQPQTAWQPDETAYADNTVSVNYAARKTMYGVPSLDISTPSFSPAVPELSPQSASQKSAPISPETPIVAGQSTQTVYPENNFPFACAISPSESVTAEKHPYHFDLHQEFELQGAFSLPELEGSTLGQAYDGFDLPLLAEPTYANNQQQVGVNSYKFWSDEDQGALPPDLQHIGSLPLSIPAFQEEVGVQYGSSDHTKELLGTWELQGHNNWARVNGHQPADPVDPSQSNALLSLPHEHLERDHDETGFAISPSEASSVPKKIYPSLQCVRCDKPFTGQYARGNMNRHASHKHALKPRRDNNCRICKKSFNRSDAVRSHVRRAHLNL